MMLRLSIVLVLTTMAVLAEDESSEKVVISTSPDERWAVRTGFELDGTASGEAEIVALPDRKVLLDASGTFMSGLSAIWAPDSSKVALNGRAGGRYETVVVYELKDESWREVESPEDATAEALLKAMDRKREEGKIPVNAHQRRIWDAWKLRRWIDADTAEVLASSIRHDYPRNESGETDDEGFDVAVYLKFRMKLAGDGTWKILDQAEVAESEMLGD